MVETVLAMGFFLGSLALFFVFAQERVVRRLQRVWVHCPGPVRLFFPATPFGLRLWLQFVAFLIFIFALNVAGRHAAWLD